MRRKLHSLRILSMVIFIVFFLGAIIVSPAIAIANPDGATTVGNVEVYEGVLAPGDLGILMDFHTFYTILPTETITEAYRISFIDTDGLTIVKTIAPYALLNKGYREGLAWLYFTPTEVTTYSLNAVSKLLYTIKVYGNPALTWVPGPAPTTSATIDVWNVTGTSNVLLSLDVLAYAQTLQTAWALHMVQTTAVGNKLTAYGASYFSSVIGAAQTVAPGAFYVDTTGTIQEDIDYTTSFGALMTNGTGTCTGSPITLSSGANTVVILTSGTFVLVLNNGTVGTAADAVGGATITGSPVTLVPGTNTITATVGGTGNIIINVLLENTGTKLADTVTGTGFDLTVIATSFGMSREIFSGMVWFVISIIICAAAYTRAGGKTTMLIFDICIIGGAVLGLMPLLVAALLFIGFGLFTAYVFFYRGAMA